MNSYNLTIFTHFIILAKPITIDHFGDSIKGNEENIDLNEKKHSLSPLEKNIDKTFSQTPNRNSEEGKKNLHRRNLSSQKDTLVKKNTAKIKDLEERAKKRKDNKNFIKQKFYIYLKKKSFLINS